VSITYEAPIRQKPACPRIKHLRYCDMPIRIEYAYHSRVPFSGITPPPLPGITPHPPGKALPPPRFAPPHRLKSPPLPPVASSKVMLPPCFLRSFLVRAPPGFACWFAAAC
jgi:hypothetical protein